MKLEEDAKNTQMKLTAASQLIKGLSGEKKSWSEELKIID
jgi:hypothetical protein